MPPARKTVKKTSQAPVFEGLRPGEIAVATRMRGIPPYRPDGPPPDAPGARERKLEELRARLAKPFSREGWNALVALFGDWTEVGRAEGLTVLHAGIDAWLGRPSPARRGAPPHLTGLWRAESVDAETGDWIEDDVPKRKRRPAQPLHARKSRQLPAGSPITEVSDAFRFTAGGGLLCFLEIHQDGTYREVDFSTYPLRFIVTSCFEMDHGTCLDEDPDPDDIASHEDAVPDHPGLVCAMPGYEHDLESPLKRKPNPHLMIDTQGFSRVQDMDPFQKGMTCLDLREGENGGGLLWDMVRAAKAGTLEREAFLRWDGISCQYRSFTYRLATRFEEADPPAKR